jgi:hypothetical protein
MLLSVTDGSHKEEFWVFHDVEEAEIVELRKFIDLELDLSSIKESRSYSIS